MCWPKPGTVLSSWELKTHQVSKGFHWWGKAMSSSVACNSSTCKLHKVSLVGVLMHIWNKIYKARTVISPNTRNYTNCNAVTDNMDSCKWFGNKGCIPLSTRETFKCLFGGKEKAGFILKHSHEIGLGCSTRNSLLWTINFTTPFNKLLGWDLRNPSHLAKITRDL